MEEQLSLGGNHENREGTCECNDPCCLHFRQRFGRRTRRRLFSDRIGVRLARSRNDADEAAGGRARHRPQIRRRQQKQENQIKAIRSFIAQGVNAILLAPVVATGWDEVLAEAKDAEIPVILLDRTVDASDDLYLTAVTSDLVHEGSVAGKWLVDTVAGKSCNVVELQGTTGSSPAIDRKKGFEQAPPATTI